MKYRVYDGTGTYVDLDADSPEAAYELASAMMKHAPVRIVEVKT